MVLVKSKNLHYLLYEIKEKKTKKNIMVLTKYSISSYNFSNSIFFKNFFQIFFVTKNSSKFFFFWSKKRKKKKNHFFKKMRGRGGAAHKVSTACEMRLQKDLQEAAENQLKITFPDENVITHFHMQIRPRGGLYHDHNFDFDFVIPQDWPTVPPVVKCITKVYHPNIDSDGNVCLNTLRKAYSPCLTINVLAQTLLFLFLEPNPNDPLDFDVALEYNTNYEGFKQKAEEYMEKYCPKD